MRLDLYLIQNGHCTGRENAKKHILEGDVLVNGKTVLKPSFVVSDTDEVEFIGEKLKYASRGGLKLEAAINEFKIDLSGKVCIDVGASSGGFTDCMLQNGAKKVYAVDVGHSQLVPFLKDDTRVVNLEKTDIRTLEELEPKPDFFSIDVSFISLKIVLPFTQAKEGVCLVKPQFEAGRKNLNKKGIVKDNAVRENVLKDVKEFAQSLGFNVLGATNSPITGGDGNHEYLLYIKKPLV